MFDLTDLNLRYRAHYERVGQTGAANRSGLLNFGQFSGPRRRLAVLLLALACRLAPELVTPVASPVESPAA